LKCVFQGKKFILQISLINNYMSYIFLRPPILPPKYALPQKDQFDIVGDIYNIMFGFGCTT